MKALKQYIGKYRKNLNFFLTPQVVSSSTILSLAACGGESVGSRSGTNGFPSSYIPPESGFELPDVIDPYFEILNISYVEPYWVTALEMDNWENHILTILENFEHEIHYTFPTVKPPYNHYSVTGWQPATNQMKTATREILSKFGEILDVTFVEVTNPEATNVIAVGRSNQTTTSGISYFPNNHYEIGMDIFLANGYGNPVYVSELHTNFDYEVLVHELGHALGLKHPFEASGLNIATLNSYEDNTSHTAMSYNGDPLTFNGTMRALDWMGLTKFYGVSPSYMGGDNVYSFSTLAGTFIIDGAGIDKISVANTSFDVTVDLRPGAHSYLGNKSDYITNSHQLTISHNSHIENVETGKGNDTVIGNDLDNIIITGSGDDMIFAGAGSDIINSGSGVDVIDISESIQETDTVILNQTSLELGFDTVYGFFQGVTGDTLDLSAILNSSAELFPLVSLDKVPNANFSGGVLFVAGSDLSTASALQSAFRVGGDAEPLSISNGASAVIISAASQSTGIDQCIFHADGRGEEIFITELAVMKGNALDIDQWHADNFNFIA